LASCLQQKTIHLLAWYTKTTLFLATCIYHSKFTSRLQGGRKERRKKKPARRVSYPSCPCHCLVPQVSTSDDTERRRLLPELSLQLSLFLDSTTLNRQMMITVV